MSTASLNLLLEQTADWDKDNRYMATSDLCTELQKDVKIDATMERRICAAVLKQLDDQSNDVQSIAVKCLGVLLKKVQKTQVGEIADKLCSLILDGKDELRDIYSIGLKTLLKDMPDEMGATVCDKLTKRLLSGVQQSAKVDVKLESLENLTDLLKRFGADVAHDHGAVLEIVMSQLAPGEKAVVKKRAASCLAALATSASDELLEQLFGTLLERIDKGGTDVDSTRTLIQTIGTISRTVGGRLGQHLDAVVPVFIKHVGDAADDDANNTPELNELRENCFQGLETFVLRCPREIAPHLEALITVSLDFAKYDPNYDDDDEDEQMVEGGNTGELDNGEDEEEDEDYGDDDEDDGDTSWKVRRAAVKLAQAIVSSRREMLARLYASVAPALVARFKEREENVRVDVIDALATLLRASKAARDEYALAHRANAASAASAAPATNDAAVAAGWAELLGKLAPSIVAVASKRICTPDPSNKCEKSKAACYSMLGDLCAVHSLAPYAVDVTRAVRVGLSDRSQALRLDAARLLRCVLDADTGAETFFGSGGASHGELIDKVAALVGESWYKLIAEGLRLVASLAKIMGRGTSETSRAEPAVANTLYNAAKKRLAARDIDHEIKECAIEAVSALVANLPVLAELPGSGSSSALTEALGLLLDRIKNESTRGVALRAVGEIASVVTPISVDLSSIAKDCVLELASGLSRQTSRALKQTALTTLQRLLENAKRRGDPEGLFDDDDVIPTVLDESARLISDEDLHLAHLATSVGAVAVRALGSTLIHAAKPAKTKTFLSVLDLIKSPVLQGVALEAIADLIVALATVFGAADQELAFDALYAAILDAANLLSSPSTGKMMVDGETQTVSSLSDTKLSRSEAHVLRNMAKALADLTARAAPSEARRDAAVADFVDCAQHNVGNVSIARVRVATLALGELGRRLDLSSSAHDPFAALMSTVKGSGANDDSKMAAACALGLVTSGAVSKLLPLLLDALEETSPGDPGEYVLLAALKEAVAAKCASLAATDVAAGAGARPSEDNLAAPSSALAPFVSRLVDRLVRSCVAAEEPARNMVAECLGALAWITPEPTASCLDRLLESKLSAASLGAEKEDDPSSRARWTAAASLKHAASAWGTTSGAQHAATTLVRSRGDFFDHFVPRFTAALGLLDDPDLGVRRQALIMLNACAHHEPYLVAHSLANIVPQLKTLVELKLERVVDLGPFKHKVDDGLPLRKSAVACVATFVDNAISDLRDRKNTDLSSVTSAPESPYIRVIPDIVPLVVVALADKSDDIQMAAHSLVCKLCDIVPDVLISHNEAILSNLDKTVNKKIRESAKAGTEADRAYDIIRSGLKAALVLAALPNAREARSFVEKIQKKDKLAAEIARLQKSVLQ